MSKKLYVVLSALLLVSMLLAPAAAGHTAPTEAPAAARKRPRR